MGVFQKIFKQKVKADGVANYFKMLDGYTPIFTTYDGGVYEMEITRACIHTFANHASKLLPTVTGADLRGIQKLLDNKPNFMMTSAQFIYKVATIVEAQNTCFIVPVLDNHDCLAGYYPCNPQSTELVEYDGQPYLRYTFTNGAKAAIELERCGVVSKFLYTNDIFGETNEALEPTMQLIDLQNQGIIEGIKSGAHFRFMAKYSNFALGDDLEKERTRFVAENMKTDKGGMLLFPNTYTDIQQIKSNPQLVDTEQMKLIQTRAFNYFGTNEEVLQNKAYGDAWAAYYEGKLEPFAVQLSQAMTTMTFSAAELNRGNRITWSSNRLQYATTAEKLQVSSQMFDRGVFSHNDIMDIWNLPHLEGGDKRYIRKEYAEITQTGGNENDTIEQAKIEEPEPNQNDASGNDTIGREND